MKEKELTKIFMMISNWSTENIYSLQELIE